MADVNQTRFHLVYGRDDWLPVAATDGLDWHDEDATLCLRSQPFVFGDRPGERPPSLDDRRGAGCDRYGNWYWIAEDRRTLRFLAAHVRVPERFWPPATRQVCREAASEGAFEARQTVDAPFPAPLQGLAVTLDHYLVSGALEPAALLVFDLYSGGPPSIIGWPAGIPLEPFDMAASPDGGVAILDRRHRRVWRLNRFFEVAPRAIAGAALPPVFEPRDGGPDPQACGFTSAVSTDQALDLSELEDPIALDFDEHGFLYLLDRAPSQSGSVVHRYRGFDHAGSAPAGEAHDMAAAPWEDSPAIYLVDIAGNQVHALRLKETDNGFELEPETAYLPLRRFGGKALVRCGGGVYYDLADERWVKAAVQPRPLYEPEAAFLLPPRAPAFDGKFPGCVWHRVLMEACIPPGAAVTFESRAADSFDELEAAAWRPDPRPALRGDDSELPFHKPAVIGGDGRAGTWEFLLQKAEGRYLQLRVTLRGTGRNTPRIHALRVYYPRFSYLERYLPAVYREDSVSASFLDRYLANTEGLYTALEDRIANVQVLFDADTAPAECLEWLAGWMGVSLDPSWSERKQRLFLKYAHRMFRERGTRAGILRALRLALEECPDESLFSEGLAARAGRFRARVVERFLTRRAAGVVYGDTTEVTGPGVTPSQNGWRPADGAGPLHERYRSWLREKYGAVDALNADWGTAYPALDSAGLRLPAVRPAHPQQAKDWERFLRQGIGFVYEPAGDSDLPAFRDHLVLQYRQPADLNLSYRLSGDGALLAWSDVKPKLWDAQLRQALPNGGPFLRDWIRFVTLALPAERRAHRFRVLVPVSLGDDAETQRGRRELARRIVEIEKPAHTDFDVHLYWSAFRAGEARVGLETLVGESSRSAAVLLGAAYLGSVHLATPPGKLVRDASSWALTTAASSPGRAIKGE